MPPPRAIYAELEHHTTKGARVTGTSSRSHFALDPESCAVLIRARSNVGAVQFGTTSLRGTIDVVRSSAGIDVDNRPVVLLELPLKDLTSGNALYDSELHQRLDVRRFPVARLELVEARHLGDLDYAVAGTVTLHGVSAVLRGTVSLGFPEDGVLTVTGDQVIDVRDFHIDLPTLLMLRLYPDVKVSLQLLAREIDGIERRD